MGLVVSLLLLVGAVILLFQPLALKFIEIFLYFIMLSFFSLFSNFNLYRAIEISKITPEYVGEVINGMTLWILILFMGAFLSISSRGFQILVLFTLSLVVGLGARNIWLIYESGLWDLIYLFHWAHSLFALAVTIFLILRIGGLQRHYATTDVLTGVLNRSEASKELSLLYEQAVRYNTTFSVILIDIDHFKFVNDTYGHPTGDLFLMEFARIISTTIRKEDFVARWGGEEFLVILPKVELVGATVSAERIRESIRKGVYQRV